METDDFIDIEPWPAPEIAGHLIAQATLGRRGLIETTTDGDVFERETDRFELEAWARLELTAWLRDAQFRLLEVPVGTLTDDQEDVAKDGLVIASTLAWALYLVKTDELAIRSDGSAELTTLDWAPTPWTPVRNVVKSLKVRSEEHLATERERWELIHWRSTLFTDASANEEDSRALAETVVELRGQGIIQTTSDDFGLDDGLPFSSLSEDNLFELQHSSEIRLRALNWVCGYGETPDTAPLYLDD